MPHTYCQKVLETATLLRGEGATLPNGILLHEFMADWNSGGWRWSDGLVAGAPPTLFTPTKNHVYYWNTGGWSWNEGLETRSSTPFYTFLPTPGTMKHWRVALEWRPGREPQSSVRPPGKNCQWETVAAQSFSHPELCRVSLEHQLFKAFFIIIHFSGHCPLFPRKWLW